MHDRVATRHERFTSTLVVQLSVQPLDGCSQVFQPGPVARRTAPGAERMAGAGQPPKEVVTNKARATGDRNFHRALVLAEIG